MNDKERLLLVLACVGCLLVVAAALPATDPRIDLSERADLDSQSGPDGDGSETSLTDGSTGDAGGGSGTGDGSDPTVEVEGALVPGNEVTLRAQDAAGAILVDGQEVGEGEGNYTVPFAEEVTASIVGTDIEETFEVGGEPELTVEGPLVAGEAVTLNATLGPDDRPLSDATVTVDGEVAGTTDENGTVTVELPAESESPELSVERGPVATETDIDLTDLDVEFASWLLLPGLGAPVQVTADGHAIENATVAVDGTTARTDEDGYATVGLPVSDEATVTATVGPQEASATVTDLYLRLAAVVLVVPSLLVGLLLTYLRFSSRSTRWSYEAAFFSLGDRVAKLPALLGALLAWPLRGEWPESTWRPSLPSPRVPAIPWPSGLLWLPSLSLPPLLGLFSGDDRERASDEAEATAGGGQTRVRAHDGAAEERPGPAAPVARHWHRFVAHLGIDRPERWTPGQVARRAVATGYPARQVRRLVETFRAVEYGGRDPTEDRVESARSASRSLREHDPEDEQ